MADDGNPILKVMAAAGLSARTVGNHEFDKGWADLAGSVNPAMPGVDQLGANVHLKGTRQAASPLKAYTTFTVGELDIAMIGAVTGNLPSPISPAGTSDLTIGDPVEAVNETVSQLPEEIDLVITSIHEEVLIGLRRGFPARSGAALHHRFHFLPDRGRGQCPGIREGHRTPGHGARRSGGLGRVGEDSADALLQLHQTRSIVGRSPHRDQSEPRTLTFRFAPSGTLTHRG